MKISALLKAGLGAACLSLLVQCSQDPLGSKPPADAPDAASGGVAGGADGPDQVLVSTPPSNGFPAPQPERSKTPPPPRAIAAEEFILTIDASGVASVAEVPVHIISTTASGAATIGNAGAAEYWKQPQSGAHVTERSFGKDGKNRTPVVRLPSVPGSDHVVLIANLSAPSGENNARVLTVPLKLDYSLDPANPIAYPLGVKLTAKGWQRTR